MGWQNAARDSSLAKRRALAQSRVALKKGQAELLVSTEGIAVVTKTGEQLFSSGPDAKIQMRLERYARVATEKANPFKVVSQPGGWYEVTNTGTGEVTRVKGKAKVEALIS